MSAIGERAHRFFEACETGEGWEVCRGYCRGFEWAPIRSYAALPRGIDVALRAEVQLYFHKFGGRIPFGRPSSALTSGVLGELPQNPIMTRPVFSLGLAIGL